MPKSVMALAILLCLCVVAFLTEARFNPASAQESDDQQAGILVQIIPGHYMYNFNVFNSVIGGVIVTSEGVVVVDALSSEAMANHERQLIADMIRQPVRFLISSPDHNNFTRGNVAYQDVIRIGHENYRTDLLARIEDLPVAEQEARLPHQTYRDRMTLHLGGKEIQILHFGPAHTRGDSIVFVPEDRIVYMSELFFYDQFPVVNTGYVSWINAIDIALNLEADIFVPSHGRMDDPQNSRAALMRFRQLLADTRDAVQRAIAQGATEDQVAATVLLSQYEDWSMYRHPQREVFLRRFYRDLKGTLE